jgi:EAL domain-containing protein (putative c-di-GMP-specific phosphodiesterase class I)/GGDEF domain-containing protein
MTLENEFYTLLADRQLHPLFQPIVSATSREIIGYEALIRGPSNSALHAPLALFDTATRFGKLFELEMICREISIAQFQRLGLAGKLFLNVTPANLLQPGHMPGTTVDLLRQLDFPADRLVIELTEQHPMDDYQVMREATAHYKSEGFQIAIDDLGAGYAGLRMWSELRPDYVKIDSHFIQGIHEDVVKQEFVRSIREIAGTLGCTVIAEGIETEDEFRSICGIGIDIAQGYYFARPQPLPPRAIPLTLFSCDCASRPGIGKPAPVRRSESIGNLAAHLPAIDPGTLVGTTIELFRNTPTLDSVPVVYKNEPIGIVRRASFMEVFVSPYARELYEKKPITILMDKNPLMVDRELPVEEVSQLVTQSMKLDQKHDFIITDNGAYLGVGTVTELLKMITDLQIRNARYANPLTLLPGNVPIYETVDQLLASHARFHVSYFDLDNFKPFNDVYGYSMGDQVLRRLGRILQEHADPHLDFVGHIGGDDFIVICRSPDWRERCQRILDGFARIVPSFYSPQDRQRAGILTKDRGGNSAFYPMLSLSVGIVSPDPERCHSHHDVAALATLAKHEAKKIQGNSIFLERRGGPDTAPAIPDTGVA